MSNVSFDTFKRNRGHSGGSAFGMSPLRFAPYRKIVEEGGDEQGLPQETLECGHKMRPRSDMIGTTYPERRRCKVCLEESCTASGHPLVDWRKNPRAPLMRCKCGAHTGAARPVGS